MNKIEMLAKRNSYETLFRQLTEEAAELIVAIQKIKRAQDEGEAGMQLERKFGNILSEIADVEICIEQLYYKDPCDKETTKIFKERKILRQLKRFELKVEE